ncbi:MAG: hypothetical protein J1F36_01975 [Clostridiales bacterium]|nr:hypothetical protein [Clostridiales bacterium]
MKQKKIVIVALVLAVIAVISGCGNGSRLNYGFGTTDEVPHRIDIGVKSKKTDFSIDNITLDFYYGSEKKLDNVILGYQDIKPVGVGVYFANVKDFNAVCVGTNFQVKDYADIDGLYFVKFIGLDEYNSGKYNVKYSWLRTRFNHKETLTVPSSVILPIEAYEDKEQKTQFCLAVIEIVYLENKGVYSGNYASSLDIKYDYIDEANVHLSYPRRTSSGMSPQ